MHQNHPRQLSNLCCFWLIALAIIIWPRSSIYTMFNAPILTRIQSHNLHNHLTFYDVFMYLYVQFIFIPMHCVVVAMVVVGGVFLFLPSNCTLVVDCLGRRIWCEAPLVGPCWHWTGAGNGRKWIGTAICSLAKPPNGRELRIRGSRLFDERLEEYCLEGTTWR